MRYHKLRQERPTDPPRGQQVAQMGLDDLLFVVYNKQFAQPRHPRPPLSFPHALSGNLIFQPRGQEQEEMLNKSNSA